MRTRRTRRPLLAVIALATVMGASLATSAEAEEVTLTLEKEAAVPTATATASASGVPTVEVPQRSLVPAYVIGGVGVVGLIAGGVLIGVAEVGRTDLINGAPQTGTGELLCRRTPTTTPTLAACDEWRAKAATVNTEGRAAVGTFVGAGVLLAAATAYWLWPMKRNTTASGTAQSWVIAPAADDHGGGVVWTGRF